MDQTTYCTAATQGAQVRESSLTDGAPSQNLMNDMSPAGSGMDTTSPLMPGQLPARRPMLHVFATVFKTPIFAAEY
jgi:hypothetical protein